MEKQLSSHITLDEMYANDDTYRYRSFHFQKLNFHNFHFFGKTKTCYRSIDRMARFDV